MVQRLRFGAWLRTCTPGSRVRPSTTARLKAGNPPLNAHWLPYAAWLCPWPTGPIYHWKKEFYQVERPFLVYL